MVPRVVIIPFVEARTVHEVNHTSDSEKCSVRVDNGRRVKRPFSVSFEQIQNDDNTQFLRDAKGSPWLYVLLVVAVIGAPLTEELLFRGLVLRAFEKRAGTLAAIVGSTALFTLLHSFSSGWDIFPLLFNI